MDAFLVEHWRWLVGAPLSLAALHWYVGFRLRQALEVHPGALGLPTGPAAPPVHAHGTLGGPRPDPVRATAISTLWHSVREVHERFVLVVAADAHRHPARQTALREWADAARGVSAAATELAHALDELAIHIDEPTAESVVALVREARTLAGPLVAAIELGRDAGGDESVVFDRAHGHWLDLVGGFAHRIVPMHAALKDAFRRRLGAEYAHPG